MQKIFLLGIALIIITISTLAGCATVVRMPPPPPARVEIRPAPPTYRAVWINGHWKYKRNHWVWVSGHWIKRPGPKAIWVPGHWRETPRGWKRVPGRWRH